ncbi:AMP-binding protein [Halocynthiibacter sp.]|uniref:AMP-binding protein n=1 Tax=Halocynthiibacter sp. TaxID=1979210 RepID=UPI003C52C5AE
MTEQQTLPLAPENGMSHVKGPLEPKLVVQTISELLAQAVDQHPDQEAVVFPEQDLRLTYKAFSKEVDRLAAGFLAKGFRKGDRLGIWSPNRFEWVLTQFATARIGVILVNINPAYRLSELEYALNKVGCKGLILARSFKTSDYLEMIRTLAPELDQATTGPLCANGLPMLEHVIVMGEEAPGKVIRFDDLLGLATPELLQELDVFEAQLKPNDPINVQFTSGTTGNPKGATLSHYNIVNNARFVTDRINLTCQDRLAIPVPLYHCFGMVMGVLGVVSKGATMVFPGEGFDAAQTAATLEKESCTAVYGVPTMFVAMLQEIDQTPRDLSSLRTGIMAGAPCPVDVMKRVNSDMNMREVTICYGMTETSPVSFQSFVDDATDKRCETVGRVHPHLEVKIIGPNGETLPVGEQGELCTHGYSVMQGYWEDTEQTKASIQDGWMHTGDLAVIDQEGFCTITGRVKDMIIRGGENIYPREIEEFLYRHPQVSEVQVFGIPHEKLGEQVCAWIVTKEGETLCSEDVVKFCNEQIAHYKIPKHVRIVDKLPMTITGKPQKFIMRKMMQEMLEKEA